MELHDINLLLQHVDGGAAAPLLVETHISYLILTSRYAYKIKKPLKFSFLDFSSPGLRKFYCYREVELNRRLAPDMYIGVLPVFSNSAGFSLEAPGDIADYAVWMKRMDGDKEMDKLVKAGKVTAQHIEVLARKVAAFHAAAQAVAGAGPAEILRRFNDLNSAKSEVADIEDGRYRDMIEAASGRAAAFISAHAGYIEGRSAGGFVRDVHGDLHTGNIFLYDDPVIFDCIEFNDGFRQIDVLDEAAFLCMDLDALGRKDLAAMFYESYLRHSNTGESTESRLLFSFWKCYRANVRAKVHLVRSAELQDRAAVSMETSAALHYLKLMDEYACALA